MRSLAVVALLAVAACSGGGDDDVVVMDPHAQFDLDVVVRNNSVTVWVRSLSGPTCNPPLRFTRPGECIEHSDAIGCSGDYETCLTRVAVERNGSEIAVADVTEWWRSISIFDAALFAGGDAELVIEGCGGEMHIPIGVPTIAPPTLTDLTTDGTDVRGATAPTGATGTWAEVSNGFTGSECHEAGDDAWRVGPLDAFPSRADLYLASIVGGTGIPTPWGDAYVWQQQLMPTSVSIALPARRNGMWQLDEQQNADITLSVDGGAASPGNGPFFMWGFREAADGVRIYASTDTLDYAAGETTDTLAVVRSDGRFIASFPHVAPTNDLDVGLSGDNRLVISLPPVTVTHESNPALTHQVALDLSLEHPLIPRPVPMP